MLASRLKRYNISARQHGNELEVAGCTFRVTEEENKFRIALYVGYEWRLVGKDVDFNTLVKLIKTHISVRKA